MKMEKEEETRILRQNNFNFVNNKINVLKNSESSNLVSSTKKENIEMYETLMAGSDVESNFYFMLSDPNEKVKSFTLHKQNSMSSISSATLKRPPPPPPPPRILGASIPTLKESERKQNAPVLNEMTNGLEFNHTGVVNVLKPQPPPLPSKPPPALPLTR